MIFRPRARGLVLALTALALSSLESGLALAHSRLQRAEPPAESRLKSPPSEVKLTFTERLEPSYSGIQVKDERGAQVDRGDAHIDTSNPLLLRASLGPLAPGTYTVNWRVLSVDGHVSEGRFAFRVE
jgi:methionine-rich copper-binding protein CopC